MANAKEEFLEHTKKLPLIIAAELKISRCKSDLSGKVDSSFSYRIEDDYEEFISKLDFKYNSGFGGQELFGNIWYEDGTWSERGEYDGSEWWEYKKCPEIPKNKQL